MHHHGSVVTRAMIIDHVWDGNDNLWTNAVDVHIKYLRDRIDRPFGTATIQTVHGVGYKLAVAAGLSTA
jgi:DNA-binding response OmpR family regulator